MAERDHRTAHREKRAHTRRDRCQARGSAGGMSARFAAGENVRVRLAWPEQGATRVHIRTPGYLRGHRGVIDAVVGEFANPEELAFGKSGLPKLLLYRVVFKSAELWPGARAHDTVAADIYENWLER